jgi:hypothetical protein
VSALTRRSLRQRGPTARSRAARRRRRPISPSERPNASVDTGRGPRRRRRYGKTATTDAPNVGHRRAAFERRGSVVTDSLSLEWSGAVSDMVVAGRAPGLAAVRRCARLQPRRHVVGAARRTDPVRVICRADADPRAHLELPDGRPAGLWLTVPFLESDSAPRSGRVPLRSRSGTPPSSVQMPQCAESAHLPGDRFYLWSDLRAGDRIGDKECSAGRRGRMIAWRRTRALPRRPSGRLRDAEGISAT